MADLQSDVDPHSPSDDLRYPANAGFESAANPEKTRAEQGGGNTLGNTWPFAAVLPFGPFVFDRWLGELRNVQ